MQISPENKILNKYRSTYDLLDFVLDPGVLHYIVQVINV